MWIVKGAVPGAVGLAVMAVLTATLWYLKFTNLGPHHPIFCYLLPIALVAIICGAASALLCTAAAVACGAYFLYDPIYSFSITKTLEWGDFVCFAVLALIGIKCTIELMRPAAKIPRAELRYKKSLLGAVIRTATPADPVP